MIDDQSICKNLNNLKITFFNYFTYDDNYTKVQYLPLIYTDIILTGTGNLLYLLSKKYIRHKSIFCFEHLVSDCIILSPNKSKTTSVSVLCFLALSEVRPPLLSVINGKPVDRNV